MYDFKQKVLQGIAQRISSLSDKKAFALSKRDYLEVFKCCILIEELCACWNAFNQLEGE